MDQDNVANQQADEQDAEEQAFLAEMAADETGGHEPAPTPDDVPANQDDDPEAGQGDNPAPEAERIEVIPGYTEAELREQLDVIPKLKRALDTTNGTYGSQIEALRRKLDGMQPPSGHTHAQLRVKAKFERLRQDYPEIADLLAEDLGELTLASDPTPEANDPQPQGQQQQAEVDRLLNEERARREQERREYEVKLLSRDHPDWQELASFSKPNPNAPVEFRNQAFGEWLDKQLPGVKDTVLNSTSAEQLSQVLTQFKAATATATEGKPGRPAPKPAANLTKAIQPKGTPTGRSASLDEEERLFREELAREDY